MSFARQFIFGLITFIFAFVPARAEELDYFLVDGVDYDPAVLQPAEILGHELADQPARHDLMVDYLRRVAEASPRMSVETIGYSHEKRPILFITVTSPENHARLEDIRQAHLKRTDPVADYEASDLPVITWVNYGVHGAEPSGMEAAIPAIYHLAAAKGTDIEATLQNSVILITAIFNPDGHSRRAGWVTQYGSNVINSNPEHAIHNHGWPGGRTNHYWFDLNRQWLLQTQPESQAWVAQWHKWKPQVSADFHEMGVEATYYFHPGIPTRKHPLIPAKGRQLLSEIAGYHASFMDSEAKLYYTEESFDNFYIGKGSTYPQVNGGLGILFEAGSAAGGHIDSQHGLKTYANNIRDHFRTSLTTIDGAFKMRDKLHAYQREFFETALSDGRKDDVNGYVFAAPEDPARLYHFLDLLARHDVDVYALEKDIRADGKTWRAGQAYIVPTAQAQYRMVKGLFGRITEFQDKTFYDVSGWTLPLAYGIAHTAVTANVGERDLGTPATADFPMHAAPAETSYAYVFRWSDYYAPRALYRLLDKDIIVRNAMEPFEVQTTEGMVAFDRGSVVVPLDRQTVSHADIHKVIETIAAHDGVKVYAAVSGRTPTPGADLGGRNSFYNPEKPNPLLIIGDGITAYDAGEVWHQLDHRMDMKVTLVRRSRLMGVDLGDYSHIFLVGGNYKSFDKALTERIAGWVKAGGTLVAHRQGAQWAEKLVRKTKPKKDKNGSAEERKTYANKSQEDAEHFIGGAIF